MVSPFAGMVAIITGGASGIGLATARRLAEAGAAVAINDLDMDRTRAVALSLGGNAMAIPGDASCPEVARNSTAEIVALWGRIDILINSAGIFCGGPSETIATQDWRRAMRWTLMDPSSGRRRPQCNRCSRTDAARSSM